MSSPETHPLVPLRLVRVVIRESSAEQWIFLEEDSGAENPRGFPIVIGSGEASEIHRIVTESATPRPLTHQLTLSAVQALGSELVGIDIVDLRSNTFYAQLRLAPPNGSDPEGAEEILVDARPSDALALALRAGAQIRVAESVLQQVRTDSGPDTLPDPDAFGGFDLEEDGEENGDTDGEDDVGGDLA
ncbi:MAG: bifunctional nuclease domain-containing protein [Planctomycetota bacterium]